MMFALLFLAAVLCLITALIHSYFGEKRLIAPIIKSNIGVMANPLAKQVLRFAWHWTSLLWVLVAGFLFSSAMDVNYNRPLLFAIGSFHLIAGVVDDLYTGGKHIGWPPITLIGVMVLIACFLS